MKPASPEPPPPSIVEETDLENQLLMGVEQVVPSETNKRKRETVSPATGSDDDDDKLEVKHGGGRSSLSSEIVAEEEAFDYENVWLQNTGYRLIKVQIDDEVREFAKIAVDDYNNKDKDEMELIEIKEAFFQGLGVLVMHINFDAMLTPKDGKDARKTTCQAVVSQYVDNPVEVHSLKFESLKGNDMEAWCKEDQCSCAFLREPVDFTSKETRLKFGVSSYEDVEDKNMNLNSPDQPVPTSIGEETNLENEAGTRIEKIGMHKLF